MQTRPKAVFAKAAELTDAKSARSVGKWMVRHHDDLLAHFAVEPLGRPDWPSFVVALAENGIARRDGTPIAAETARRTWSRVKTNVAKSRGAKALKAKPSSYQTKDMRSHSSSISTQPPPVIIIGEPAEEEFKLILAGGPASHKKDKTDV